VLVASVLFANSTYGGGLNGVAGKATGMTAIALFISGSLVGNRPAGAE
jgi:hypothetical protein